MRPVPSLQVVKVTFWRLRLCLGYFWQLTANRSTKKIPIGVGELSSTKRRRLNEIRCDPASKRRIKRPVKRSRSFPSANSSPEDTSLRKLPKTNSQDGSIRGSEDDQALEEKVWEHDELIGYREIDGREEVLVPWGPTWEPAKEYPREEVDKVKKKRKRTETALRAANRNKRNPQGQGRHRLMI